MSIIYIVGSLFISNCVATLSFLDMLGYQNLAEGLNCPADLCVQPVECDDGTGSSHVICDSTKSKIIQINLVGVPSMKLNGTIPSQIARIKSLKALRINNNNIHGTIPDELFELTSLEILNLQQNDLVGTIPTEIGKLQALSFLRLNNNHFNGTMPTHMALLTSLEILRLQENDLTGSFASPGSVFSAGWSNLQELDISSNHFTGQLFLVLPKDIVTCKTGGNCFGSYSGPTECTPEPLSRLSGCQPTTTTTDATTTTTTTGPPTDAPTDATTTTTTTGPPTDAPTTTTTGPPTDAPTDATTTTTTTGPPTAAPTTTTTTTGPPTAAEFSDAEIIVEPLASFASKTALSMFAALIILAVNI